MRALDFATQRVRAVLAEIENLKDEDFPYRDSRSALRQIESLFADRYASLSELGPDDDPNVITTACSEALLQQDKFLRLLGFIVRSTSVRNSFEVFWPLWRMARQILGSGVKLILSSEWLLSPHVYRPIADLPGYVLIGLPATETSNPLLVPLAGHELGHTTWQQKNLHDTFGPGIWQTLSDSARARSTDYRRIFDRDFDNDLFVGQNLAPAYQLSMSQVEESFCDFFGVRLFGESYFHAFAYLVSPGGGRRDPNYPDLHIRIENLKRAAEVMSFEVPSGFVGSFVNELAAGYGEKEQFQLEIADLASLSIRDSLIAKAVEIADQAHMPRHSSTSVDKVKFSFTKLTPASGIGDLSSILAAAWELYYDQSLWRETVTAENRLSTLSELVLKSIEILEFEERTRSSDDS